MATLAFGEGMKIAKRTSAQQTYHFLIPLALFVASAFIGLWASYDRVLSLPALLALLGSVGVFLVVVNAPAWYQQVSGALVIASALLAIYFVGQYGHLDYQDETGILAQLGRRTGSLMPALVFFKPHPNAVASFLEGAFLLNIALIWGARQKQRWGWGATAAIMAYALLITGSRGAWLGLVMALSIWLILTFPKRAKAIIGGGLGLTIGFLAGGYAIFLALPNQHIFILSSILDTAQSRLTLYKNSLYLLKDYPLTGIGLGDTFALVYSRYQLLMDVPFLYYAHNLFLAVWLGQGILGLVALVWLLIAFYRLVWRVERAGLPKRPQRFFRAAWLGASATFVHGLLDSAQFSGDRWTMPMLFALLGLSVAIGNPALEKYRQKAAEAATKGAFPLKRSRFIPVTAGLLGAAALFWWGLNGGWQANAGAVHQTWADLSPKYSQIERETERNFAAASFERALTVNPQQATANRRLGVMALEDRQFNNAIGYLERAYAQEPHNQATLKALGYAYLWTGNLEQAELLFKRVDFQRRLIDELHYWRWWWGTQDNQELSTYANEMLHRLSGN